MSKYNLATMLASQYELAAAPYLGCHWAIYITLDPTVLAGEIEWDGTTAEWTPNLVGVLPAPAGSDLQVVARVPLLSPDGGSPVLTFAGLDNTSSPIAMGGTATFAPPGWAEEQSMHFQSGYAVDVVPATLAHRFTRLTGVTVAHAEAGAAFRVYALPDLAGYQLLGGTTNLKWIPRDRAPKSVAYGSNAAQWVVEAAIPEQVISFEAVFKGFGDGAARFDGVRCTLMAVALKDGLLTGDRVVFPGTVLRLGVSTGADNGTSTCQVEGTYRDILALSAQLAPPVIEVPASPVMEGIWLWCAADRLALANNARVTVWPDLSGHGRDWQQLGGFAGNRPTFHANADGYAGVYFDQSKPGGATQYLANAKPEDFATLTGADVFLVFEMDWVPAQYGNGGLWNFTSPDWPTHHPYSDNVLYDGTFSTTRRVLGTNAPTAFWHIWEVASANGYWQDWSDGIPDYPYRVNTFYAPNLAIIELGADVGRSVAFQGHMAELIIYPAPLSPEARAATMAYLRGKYPTPSR